MNTLNAIFDDGPVTMAVCEAGAGYSIPAPGVEDGAATLESRHAETLPADHYPDQTTDTTVRLLVDRWVEGVRDGIYHPGDPAKAATHLIAEYLRGIPMETGIVSQQGFRVRLLDAIQDETDYLYGA